LLEQVDATTGESFKYSEFKMLVQHIAGVLVEEYKIKPRSSVICCSKNDLYYFIPVYAALAVDAVVYTIPAYSRGSLWR
jgi:acyl-CoA synthetase (AMP-forming)/AMP-acid ligase II